MYSYTPPYAIASPMVSSLLHVFDVLAWARLWLRHLQFVVGHNSFQFSRSFVQLDLAPSASVC